MLSQEPLIRKYEVKRNQKLSVNGNATAIAFTSEKYLGSFLEIILNNQAEKIPLDADAGENTYFKSFDGEKEIYDLELPTSGSLHLINSGLPPAVPRNHKIDQQNCEFNFQPILQEDWRAGLPEPSYSRSFTDVAHVIIHHSAGSNEATNYTQVVRDIYIFHTESRGWSDIGYNYLIAQNGDIYAGRDPDGGAQDNVMGAHFCGRNSTTMGICLMGNYETASPTADTWSSLKKIVGFKLQKEDLDPLTSANHPLGDIGHIAGHRDGCSTLCPGENVYQQLGSLRSEINEYLYNCGEPLLEANISAGHVNAGDAIEFTNQSSGYDSYYWIFEGGNPASAEWQENGSVLYEYGGVFDVWLIGRKDGIADTVFYSDAIVVKDELFVFPNPVKSKEQLTIATEQDILDINIFGVDGKIYWDNIHIEGHTLSLPQLRQGMYFLAIRTATGLEKRKLLVH